jgi:L-ascorbate metabolism protein UlaG (beta-lactamase superfamily)
VRSEGPEGLARRQDLATPDGVRDAVTFRWLGVAGVELRVAGQVLLVDPFLTRQPFHRLFVGRPHPDAGLLAAQFPRCEFILVTHSHWDHLLDVPCIALRTGAMVLGSPNTCQIAAAYGVPAEQIRQVGIGEQVALGAFDCEVLAADHGRTPLDWLINGRVPEDLEVPLRLRDYRMDTCFSFLVKAGGVRILLMPGASRPADVMMVAANLPSTRLTALLGEVGPRLVVPAHWDNLYRPVTFPLRPMLGPPTLAWPPFRRMDPDRFKTLVEELAPAAHVLLPELFAVYRLDILDG